MILLNSSVMPQGPRLFLSFCTTLTILTFILMIIRELPQLWTSRSCQRGEKEGKGSTSSICLLLIRLSLNNSLLWLSYVLPELHHIATPMKARKKNYLSWFAPILISLLRGRAYYHPEQNQSSFSKTDRRNGSPTNN